MPASRTNDPSLPRPRLRIAHIVGHAALNGVATSVKTLIDEQIKAGHEIMLVHPRNSWIEEQDFARPVAKLATRFKMTPDDLRRTGYPIRDWGRSLIHAHGSKANRSTMMFRLADGVPAVMTAHHRIFQLPWLFAHAVIAPSRDTAEFYRRNMLVSQSRMHVVPNMFDIDSVEPVTPQSRAETRAALGLRQGAFVLGSVGLIGARKYQLDMIAILKIVLAAGIDAELVLIGSDRTAHEMPEWNEAISDPAIAGRLHLPGERRDAVRLLHAFDLDLCTSRMEEAPIAPLEAMASELPLLSTRVGNMPALIDHGRNGWLFPPGDVAAMANVAMELAAEPERREQVGRAARATVAARLSPAAILPRIEDAYWAAIARAHDRGRKHFGDPNHRLDV